MKLLAALLALLPATGQRAWKSDPIWHDGQAEKCVYVATRTIYGVARRYQAIAYTNKEQVDPKSATKAPNDVGLEVFKHHWSERVPTEKYDYDFSTMTYTLVSDLSAFKLSAATQEDCGASFKEVWRDGERLRFFESVYFPGTGVKQGVVASGTAAFFDGLTLSLRDYDFDAKRALELDVLPMQKDTHSVPFVAERRTVRFAGTAELELPIGKLAAHTLELVTPAGEVEARFSFAADGSAPRLHVLVAFSGPQGITYELERQERTAYWKR